MLYDTVSSFTSFTDSFKDSFKDSFRAHSNSLRSHGSTLKLRGSTFAHTLRRVKPDHPPIEEQAQEPAPIPTNVFLDSVPIRIRYLFSNVDVSNISEALSQVTIGNIVTLLDVARDQELNATTIDKLYEEASKMPKFTDRPLMAAALVICIILILFPMGVANPVLVALGFHHIGSAAAAIGAALKTMFGAKAILGLMQSAAAAVQNVSVVQGTIRGFSVICSMATWWRGGDSAVPAPIEPLIAPRKQHRSFVSRIVNLRTKLSTHLKPKLIKCTRRKKTKQVVV